MDYKEAYDDICQKLMSAYNTTSFIEVKKAIGQIHPELRESEDEITRKRLINLIRELASATLPIMTGGYFIDGQDKRYIAYLEKQKEQKHPDGCFTCDEYKKGYEEGRRNGFTAGYNKAIKEVEQKEQKPVEWSYPYGRNETVDRLVSISECLEMDGDCLFNGYSGTDCGKFLRELARKQIECKPVEWSEEDEDKLYRILATLLADKEVARREKPQYSDALCEAYDELIAWLKSLRPSRKPSEWQMSMLLAVINDPNNAGSESCYLTLKSIYEQLKKL